MPEDLVWLGITFISDVRVVDIYWLDADLPLDKLEVIYHHLLADPVEKTIIKAVQDPKSMGTAFKSSSMRLIGLGVYKQIPPSLANEQAEGSGNLSTSLPK